jgi:transposase-like protein
MADSPYPKTRQDFVRMLGSEQQCVDYLVALRWPDGFVCPACEGSAHWRHARGVFECRACSRQTSVTAGTLLDRTRKPLRLWFEVMWLVASQKNGASAKNLQQALGLGSYETAWAWLHKLRRAMIRPGREQLRGVVEVDETYIGGHDPGVLGRSPQSAKTLVAVAVECVGDRIGRVRFRCIPNAGSAALHLFVKDHVEPGAQIITDGWNGYAGLEKLGFGHTRKSTPGKREAGEPLPHVHLVASLVKRWLLGTHQGAVRGEQLPYYLDEYAFRFNRRMSTHRGLLFHRLASQAVAHEPRTYAQIITPPQALV